jgi:site-specific DNA-cytosine methylase
MVVKVLELFAWSRSIWKACNELWLQCFSSDRENFAEGGGIDYVVDILDFDISKIPFKPDVIWASPPCQWFSVACIGRNRNKDWSPKTDSARLWILLLEKTLEIIEKIQPKYFFIENPRGMMRKMPHMKNFIRHTVTYCQYWDVRMKPTDIWTNNENRKPKQPCKNWDSCHISAPRGSKTGTQGLKWDFERSRIPHKLCLEVMQSCI